MEQPVRIGVVAIKHVQTPEEARERRAGVPLE
jgi:hypothetical protein